MGEDIKENMSEEVTVIGEELIEDEKEQTYTDLTVDQLAGVGAVTKKKLETFGVTNLIDICVRGGKEISEITGVDKEKANNWVFQSQQILETAGLVRKSDMGVLELMKYQENYPRTMSKCKEVDDLFGGGLTPEAVYEVFGEFGSGKTQFCVSIVAETIAKGDNVVWIDCEDTFKPARLKEILLARELITEDEVEETLSRIRYFHTPNTEQLLGTVNSLSKLFSEIKPTLLIMDGAIGQFREEYLGRGTLADRQNQIARLMTHIKNISYFFKCVVVFTNQVQSDPAVMFGDPIKPIGGNIVGHASTYRVYFKKQGKKRLARMIDSPEHAMVDAAYQLGAKGLEDVDE